MSTIDIIAHATMTAGMVAWISALLYAQYTDIKEDGFM